MWKIKLVVAVILLGVSGCSVGLAARELRGRHAGFRVKTVMPLYELRAKRALGEKLDATAWLQFNEGAVKAEHLFARGKATGTFGAGGVGLDYYPFPSRLFGLSAGLESFAASYRMRGNFGPLGQSESDRFFGFGVRLGFTGEIPLGRASRFHLLWGAGYGLSALQTHSAAVDLDGWYGQVGLRFSLEP
jgi:hypothetical protein